MIKDIVKKLKISSTLRINEISKELESKGKEVFKFGFGQSPFKIPEDVINELRNNPYIRTLNINKEDLIRVEGINTLVKIKDFSKNKDELNKYLINLDIKVYFTNLSKSNINRAAQLCQKTNQFNSTTISNL